MNSQQREGLPEDLRTGVEALSGVAMDGTKIYTDSAEPARVHAQAFTHNSEVHVAPDQEPHLPHEAWHVVQQNQGRVRTVAPAGSFAVDDNAALEQEADAMGGHAAETANEVLAQVRQKQ